MRQGVYRFLLAALLYWLCTAYAGLVLALPPEPIIQLSSFLPPMLGLMWGPAAAFGVYAGALLASPDLAACLAPGGTARDWLFWAGRSAWVFLAAYLPCRLWHSWRIGEREVAFPLRTRSLTKFLAIMLGTFLLTSALQALAATGEELAALPGRLGEGGWRVAEYFFVSFLNDFDVAVFFGMVWLFFLISDGYAFYEPPGRRRPSSPYAVRRGDVRSRRVWLLALVFYASFVAFFAYIDLSGIVYGMDNLETWIMFNVECLTMMDAALALMLYFLLRFRHSVMMEAVALVASAVFISAAVLGWGCSVALGQLIGESVDDTLEEMGIICRERLKRTLHGARQAVDGMAAQAADDAGSYAQLAEDAAYREAYLAAMERDFAAIAASTDGSIAFYLRLVPAIGGTQGGFSWGREADRWEGAASEFQRRTPIDLALYDPEDAKNVGWYYQPVKSGCATWIEPYIDPTAKGYVLSYVRPLYVEGRLVGVVGMDIDFDYIIHELRRMSVYEYGYVYLTNRNGSVLYHKDYRQGDTLRPAPGFYEIETYLVNGMWLGIATPMARVYADRNRVIMHLVAAMLLVAMLVSLAGIFLASRLLRPLASLTEAARKIAAGDLNVTLAYDSGNELGVLVRSVREMAEKLEIYVYRDKLTGLRNAAAYMSKGADLDANRAGARYAVVIFDANFLKRVNDCHGHEAGNELIRRAAGVICRVFAHSPVYRTGGDEFAAVLEGRDYEQREALLRLFDEQAAKESFEADGERIAVSVARGIADYEEGMDYTAVAQKADAAMYEHKAALKRALGEDVR